MLQKEHRNVLFSVLWRCGSKGVDPIAKTLDIERDGRKREKVIRQLREDGYLDELTVTSKVLDEIEATKPDLIEHYNRRNEGEDLLDGRFERAMYGISSDDMTIAERAYVMTHPDEFQFVQCKDGHYQTGYTPIEWGERDSYWALLFVSSDDLVEHLRGVFRQQKIDHYYKMKHVWGLETIVGVEEEDAVAFFAGSTGVSIKKAPAVRRDSALLVGGDLAQFTVDRISKTMETVNALQARLNAMVRVNQAVTLFGGWEKYQAAYLEAITNEVDEEITQGY